MALPLEIRIDALTYVGETESDPESRDMKRISDLADVRYGKTDAEK